MDSMKILMVLAAVAAIALVGNTAVKAITAPPGDYGGTCDHKFSMMDSGNKGYLTEQDFLAGSYDVGGRIGIGPSNDYRFSTANLSGTGKLTKDEYCRWVNHR